MPEPDPIVPIPQNTDIEFYPKRRYLYSCLVLSDIFVNKEMARDGSVTPIEFSFSPIAGEIDHIEGIRILMIADGDFSHSNFGNRNRLVNGLELEISLRGDRESMCVFKDNADIVLAFTSNTEVGSSISGVEKGFLETPDYFLGEYAFKNPLRLSGDENEFLRFIVKDDLSSLTTLQTSLIISRPM